MNTMAAIHAARKQLAIDDDTARDVYQRVTGKRSLRAMTEGERQAVVTEFRTLGFERKKLTGKYAPKLQALWIAGWNLGIIRNRDDAALLAFVRKQTGLDHVRFLHDAADARAAIEALKSWLKRQGGVDWSTDDFTPIYETPPGYRIAWAQWRKLGNQDRDAFWTYVAGLLRAPIDFEGGGPIDSQWITVMNALGRQIRGRRIRGKSGG